MRTLLWLAVAGLCGSLHAGPGDEIVVPGGVDALLRYFGLADVPPHETARAVNQVLLTSVRTDHDASKIPERVALLDYLNTIAAIERRFGSRISLSGTADWRGTYIELSKLFGFHVGFDASGPILDPRASDGTQNRREVARALRWDLADAGRQLLRDRTVELALDHEPVPSPVSAQLWTALTGQRFDSTTALEMLAKDQRLGLMLAGLHRLDRATAEAFRDGRLLGWLYANAPVSFCRYAAALQIRDGGIRIPGGETAHDAWTAHVGPSPQTPIPFAQHLLSGHGGRIAYLWHALFFQPEEVARFYIFGPPDGGKRDRLTELLRAINDIDEIAAFSHARGTGLGLSTLIRSVPLDLDEQRLALPGGSGVWLAALDGSSAPKQAEALDKAATKWSRKEPSDTVFLRRTLKSDVELGPFKLPVLPRLTRVVHLFGDDLELLTSQNVILLTRSADRYPMALSPLESISPTDPDVIRDYMLAVRRMDALDHGPDNAVLVTSFQGGVELLRLLWQGDSVDSGVLEEHLQQWSLIHQTEGNLHAAAPRQLTWLVSLLEALPPADPDSPGRGHFERALLRALATRRDPQEFTWKGLRYRGRRQRDVAGEWVRHLEGQGIPSADQLVEFRRQIATLRETMGAGDLERSQQIARDLATLVRELPPAEVTPALEGNAQRPWFEAVDRPELIGTVDSIARVTQSRKLAGQAGKLGRIERLTARELRSFLLAPAYLPGLVGLDGTTLENSSLLRRHSPIRYIESSSSVLGDSAWGSTEILPGNLSSAGTRFVGHLGGLAGAFADFHFVADTTGRRTPLTEHLRTWFADAASTPWHRLTPEVSASVAELVAAGSAILDRAAVELSSGGGPAVDRVTRVVPRARFERFVDGRASLAPSERLLLGLADRDDPAARDRLALVGNPTPAIDGHSRRSIREWPPYEALESEGVFEALAERKLVDLRLTIILYLGSNGLPGEVGADLMQRALGDLAARLRLRTRLDWESFLHLLASLDDAYLDQRMRECLENGLYKAEAF